MLRGKLKISSLITHTSPITQYPESYIQNLQINSARTPRQRSGVTRAQIFQSAIGIVIL
jgi:hypothetical protein